MVLRTRYQERESSQRKGMPSWILDHAQKRSLFYHYHRDAITHETIRSIPGPAPLARGRRTSIDGPSVEEDCGRVFPAIGFTSHRLPCHALSATTGVPSMAK
jgi:hypothetical protein